jgi:hypothetical protein
MAKLKQRLITDAEWMKIRIDRLELDLGYRIHESQETTESGKKIFYFWSMGRQPDEKIEDRISATTPEAAAKKFLKLYLPKEGTRNKRDYDDCIQPVLIVPPEPKTTVTVTRYRLSCDRCGHRNQ